MKSVQHLDIFGRTSLIMKIFLLQLSSFKHVKLYKHFEPVLCDDVHVYTKIHLLDMCICFANSFLCAMLIFRMS